MPPVRVVAHDDVEVERSHLASIDHAARDVPNRDLVASPAQGERQRRARMVIGRGEPEPMAQARLEPGNGTFVHRSGAARGGPSRLEASTRARHRGTCSRNASYRPSARATSSTLDRILGSNTIRRPPSDLEPDPGRLDQQPLHHAGIEHRGREPAVGRTHVERPVESLGFHVLVPQPDGVLHRRDRPGGHDGEIGPLGPGLVDDAHEALLVVARSCSSPARTSSRPPRSRDLAAGPTRCSPARGPTPDGGTSRSPT